MTKKDLIIIDKNKIVGLVKKGNKFLFKKEAENSLDELLQLQELVNEAVEQAKLAIGELGLEIHPGFKGVIGSKVRCTFRKYGAKYKFAPEKKEELLPYLTTKEQYGVNAEKVERYLTNTGKLPEGIFEAKRESKLSMKRVPNED